MPYPLRLKIPLSQGLLLKRGLYTNSAATKQRSTNVLASLSFINKAIVANLIKNNFRNDL